ncbi:restriction endonuclease subunit S [Marinomonas shanghaiensis]|uniref:restriction endonuclease subunit S n=1 Tax=Marinomonas shanghaiensis TaxID=2202418 RepID=UPI003A915645
MKLAKLGEITEIRTGKLDVNAGTEDGQYPFFTCAATPYKINEFAFDTEAVLIAGNGDLNVKYYRGKFNAYQRTYVVQNKDKDHLSMKYLYYFIETYMDHLRKEAIGGIIKYIKLGHLTEAEIPLPPFNDQIRIAHLLGRVEGLIAHRKQHLKQLDDLLKSVFLEMFGDPVRNEKGWDKKPFSDLLVDIESGKSPKCEARPATDEEWGVLKLGSVTRCVFDANENKALPTSIAPTIKHEVKSGDLLFSRKNTYDLVAACAYVYEARPRLLMPDLIFRFVFKEDAEVNPIYIWKLLTNNSQRKAIQAFAAGAAGSMPNISKTNLKTAQLPIPSIDLQNQFAAIVEKVEALKSRYLQSLSDLESLYGALSQQAFKGELDLSWVPLPEETIASDDNEIPEVQSEAVIEQPQTSFEPLLLSGLDDYPMSTPHGRTALLGQMFEQFLNEQKANTSLNLDDFWQLAHFRSLDYMDEDSAPFGQQEQDYESVKTWVFKALKTERLQQVQNESYCVIETKETVCGNMIELKTGTQL